MGLASQICVDSVGKKLLSPNILRCHRKKTSSNFWYFFVDFAALQKENFQCTHGPRVLAPFTSTYNMADKHDPEFWCFG